MWTRKELKGLARVNLRNNYWRILGVILVTAFFLGSLGLSIPSKAIDYVTGSGKQVDNFKTMGAIVNRENIKEESIAALEGKLSGKSNTQILEESLSQIMPTAGLLKTLGGHYRPTKGALSNLFNNITSADSYLFGFLNSLNQLVFKGRIWPGITIGIGAILMLAFTILFKNLILVARCRFFIETRSYYDTSLWRLTFPWVCKKTMHIAAIILLKNVYLFLWLLTVVGFPIKYYSYKMLPYILAENPTISRKEAILLTRRMMYGNKWNAFLLDLSFLGWEALNLITFGISNWLWTQPYRVSTGAELYMSLRKNVKELEMEGSQFFFDSYIDVTPRAGTYPHEKYPIKFRNFRLKANLDCDRRYSAKSIILMFFLFSLIGWIWEVSLGLFSTGEFANRGILHGPWLPIYGAGGTLIIILLHRFAKSPIAVFALSMIVCGMVEYSTAWYLWEFKHMKYWDYSGYFLNFQGRICLEGLLVFAMGGCAAIYILGPFLDELFKKIPKKLSITLCIILLAIFSIDFIYSHFYPNEGKGISNYASVELVKNYKK